MKVKEKQTKGIVKHTFRILKEKPNSRNLIIISFIALAIYSFLYGVWRIPFLDFGIFRMSSISVFDYIFILLVAVLSSLLIVLFIYEKKNYTASSSVSAMSSVGGGFAGFFASICPVCQGIVIVALGSTLLNIPTVFLIPYLNVFKITSLGLLGLALSLKAQSIYTGHCEACNIINKNGK